MSSPKLQVARVKLSSIKPDETNIRKHGPRDLAVTNASLDRFGQVQFLLVQQGTMRIIDGNGRYELMKTKGIDEADVVLLDVTDDEAKAIQILFHRAPELASWDLESLPDTLSRLDALGFDQELLLGFRDEDLEELVKDAAEDAVATVEDDDVEPPTVAVTKLGDVWTFPTGHRLMCGDSTDPNSVAQLMNGEKASLFQTDPPYLVDYDGSQRPGDAGKDWSDTYHEVDIKDADAFFRGFIHSALPHLDKNAAWYCWHASKRQPLIDKIWTEAGAFVHQQIIWVKPSAVLSYSMYHWQHEPCLMGWIRGNRPDHDHVRDHTQTTVWKADWDGKARPPPTIGHPTSKPLELFAVPMRKHTARGAICYEPFSGSGSQLIAGEQLGRRVYAMELEPKFVDVAVMRYAKLTGKVPTKQNGESFPQAG